MGLNIALVWPSPFFPIGLMSIAAVLERAGYHPKLFTYNLEGKKKLVDALQATPFDLVGISFMTNMVKEALEVAELAKRANPHCLVVAGGAHPTALPEDTVRFAGVDAVGIGEGELTVLEMAQALEHGNDWRDVPGLVLKDAEGRVQATGSRPFIEDLDSVPLPAWHLVDDVARAHLREFPPFPHTSPYLPVMASRGCFGNCLYCQPLGKKLFGRKVRYRSVGHLLSEIEMLQRHYGVHNFLFMDDTINTSVDWLREFHDELNRRGIKMRWEASGARVNKMTEEVARLLAGSGCICAGFGIESGSQRVLNTLRKGTKVDQAREAVRLCKKYGLMVVNDIMIGSPGETEEEIQKTIDLCAELDCDIVIPHITQPTPGSDLFYRYGQGLGSQSYDAIMSRDQVTLNLSQVSDQRLQELLDELWARVRRARRGSWLYLRTRLIRVALLLKAGRLRGAFKELTTGLAKWNGWVYILAHGIMQLGRRWHGQRREVMASDSR